MRQAEWDALEVRKWSALLRARSLRYPLSRDEKDRIAGYVRDRIAEWAQLFPEAF